MHVWWKENLLYYDIHYYNIIIIYYSYLRHVDKWCKFIMHTVHLTHFKDKIWNQVQMQFNLR